MSSKKEEIKSRDGVRRVTENVDVIEVRQQDGG